MRWDSSRPVPWKRLLREWAVYGAVFAAALLVFSRDDANAGAIVWVVFTLPVYVGLGYVLAKFGYRRKTLRDLRAEAARRSTQQGTQPGAQQASATTTGRAKPPPTRRTSGGRPGSARPPARSGKGRRR